MIRNRASRRAVRQVPWTRPAPVLARLHRRTLAVAVALAFAACAPDSDAPPTVIRVADGAGRTVSLAAPAHRVVSLVPAISEWIVAMGAADRLVARTDYDRAAELRSLPSVGGGLDPSVEWLADRRPDLVFAWPDAPSRSLVARLEALGIPVYTSPVETVEQAFSTALDVGRLLGLDEEATATVAMVRSGLDSVAAAVDGLDRPAVLFLVGLDPPMAAGPGTFIAQLLALAGARNVLAGAAVRWPQLSMEEVVRAAPEVIIVGSAAAPDPLARLSDRPGWRDTPALRQGRVYPVDPDFVNRPGPRLGEAAARLADLLHPAAGAVPRAEGGPR